MPTTTWRPTTAACRSAWPWHEPGSGTLSGTTAVAVSGGVATFNNLSINQAGTGYTLVASASGAAAATSSAFNVRARRRRPSPWRASRRRTIIVWRADFRITASFCSAAAHDGAMGLKTTPGNDWIYRNDAAALVEQGDTLSVWVEFVGTSNVQASSASAAAPAAHLRWWPRPARANS